MHNILITGGAGYIGSHTLIELIEAGFKPIVVDSLVNGNAESIRRVEALTNTPIKLYVFDVGDTEQLQKVFEEEKIDAVIHFAGFKYVGESIEKALLYYQNNIVSTLQLLDCMRNYGVKKLIFSSSSTVYGNSTEIPVKETTPTGKGLLNPYARTKHMLEQILQDVAVSFPDMEISLLRYFNPIGAHPSGQIGENPNDTPANLMPRVLQSLTGKLPALTIWGDDYETPDGTCIRDYIHVVDLAKGHVAALKHMRAGAAVYNLGTGKGTSVFELIKAFEEATGRKVPYTVCPRREGDIITSYGDVSKAAEQLSWKAEKTVTDACADAWRWQQQNPNGYATSN